MIKPEDEPDQGYRKKDLYIPAAGKGFPDIFEREIPVRMDRGLKPSIQITFRTFLSV
jgi:hypothetical protein